MTLSLTDLAEGMKDLDTCLLCTRDGEGMDARPMSNNQDVEWDGSSWFFTNGDEAMVEQIRSCPEVMVTYASKGLWVAVVGRAELHQDQQAMERHWDPDIDRWFEQGVQTPGLTLIEVQPRRIRYWSFEDGDGEVEWPAR
ncbi:pyridoxamine 5'-phosphate oxidase family protein [Luteococcus peritonei]|uniref:Pyridoxamine 5'-phosphate oxidase family protein n=1 Tax=Luteococcus peritonei TaxID=88874 RepID=A0ABW4RXX2_9ACTN